MTHDIPQNNYHFGFCSCNWIEAYANNECVSGSLTCFSSSHIVYLDCQNASEEKVHNFKSKKEPPETPYKKDE